MSKETKNCPCGFPQAFPIPHEHDQTDREKQIVAYFEGKLQAAEDKLAKIRAYAEKISEKNNQSQSSIASGMLDEVSKQLLAILNEEQK